MSDRIQEGGAAESEMTVRDAFAAQFIAGALTAAESHLILLTPDVEAERAYRFADAMMRVRNLKELPPVGGTDDQTFRRGVFEMCRTISEITRSLHTYRAPPGAHPGVVRACLAAGAMMGQVNYALGCALNDTNPLVLESFVHVVDGWFAKYFPKPAAAAPVTTIRIEEVLGRDPAAPRKGRRSAHDHGPGPAAGDEGDPTHGG